MISSARSSLVRHPLQIHLQNSAAHAKRRVGSLDLVVPGVLHTSDKPIGASSCSNDNSTRVFIWIVREFVEPDLRFGPDTQFGFINKNEIRDGPVSASDQLVRMDRTPR